jgi:glutathione synthase
VKDGLYFVGIDIISGKLVEVNVMSLGGITYINKVKITGKSNQFLESKVLEQSAAFRRKTDLKRSVEEA